ncbi:MAG: hypothetical protein K8R45_15595 [Desulfobacterales bacterium]|nr:hypothetical protein [Desulfobacterales bacterium]
MGYVLVVCDQYLGGPGSMENLFVLGFSRFIRYLIAGELSFGGGMVLTCAEKKI